MNYLTGLISCFVFTGLLAQENKSVKPDIMNAQRFLMLEPVQVKPDSVQFKTPQYKQGFFCNFEDQLNRKKVPIDFSLGNSKY